MNQFNTTLSVDNSPVSGIMPFIVTIAGNLNLNTVTSVVSQTFNYLDWMFELEESKKLKRLNFNWVLIVSSFIYL